MILEEYAIACQCYFGIKSKRRIDSGSYFAKIWTARSISKDKARFFLPTKETALRMLSGDFFNYLAKYGVLKIIMIEDGDYKAEHCIIMPQGFELINLLKDCKDTNYNINLEEAIDKSINDCIRKINEETLKKLQSPLRESDGMTAKSAIFAFYLILTGAVSKNTAFVYNTDDKKQIEYQDDIVAYLNDLSRDIFPDSFYSKSKGKQFSAGDLDDFLRRDKDIRQGCGNLYKKDDNHIYFDFMDNKGRVIKESAQRLLKIIFNRFKILAKDREREEVEKTVFKVVEKFIINSPLKQAHRTAFYVGQVDFKYGLELEENVNECFESEDDLIDSE